MDTITTFGSWFPAAVLLPAEHLGSRVHHRCRVYVTSAGLRVFTQRPAVGDEPDWESPLVAGQPVPNWTARNIGVDILTEAGMVTLTPSGSCGCGSALKRWAPVWANQSGAWPV